MKERLDKFYNDQNDLNKVPFANWFERFKTNKKNDPLKEKINEVNSYDDDFFKTNFDEGRNHCPIDGHIC